ncbi:pyridoxal-phosphate dependent enzyme [Mesorhizobium sp. M4B.F.Ca.ET.215.01.1.1]|uniref:pyridoxal-phosphate dependent enzyme n=1 Tax=unclassified Mesorhizobium TaxID=325217 RepID=UPI000FE85FF1|nr:MULTISPECIES: pyridoxal-phosphate dependent enzyme [unclassified Mesorhizobium]RWC82884.1 MAG: pyridoxal-phosphate dependent enzyme [Mesorhizobium sp.]TGQ05199.1 pyridoxal-phosphate dependent enzyme [Mesorhizobium sp. M4B.F.Ca.ET.215.01.1.1]TGQ30505.1 pyridoxal-phosphate dependent enzyme [Mesorhizobium sp. M00.F.Ca.ET.220.01.1.1]TGQ97745.1 pyridoxal-phosphate dependent enzyme [Mesorhizobium sp. M4B.F.Ca.ET.203.01.1.1]TIV38379.1 MAG: pyridoxal-phosphate dependent enzyme [Mesorhizobium sp.]
MDAVRRRLPFSSYSDAYALPSIIKCGTNLYLAQFAFMKLLPAKYIIEKALARGNLTHGMKVIETSSGTFALGLAVVCREHGFQLEIFTDPVMDKGLENRLISLGAEVVIITEKAKRGGYQRSRLDALNARMRQLGSSCFWPRQYETPDNPAAYKLFADQISEMFGADVTVVGSVGSGGSTCGTIERLRQKAPGARLVGVDTFNSVIFGQPDGERKLRGLGNSLVPKNVKHELYDEVHFISAPLAFAATRTLHERHAVFAGPTSGASYIVGRWRARQYPDDTVVVVCPDEGHRYVDAVYDDKWLEQNGCLDEGVPLDAPATENHPSTALPPWNRYHWNRRSREAVLHLLENAS